MYLGKRSRKVAYIAAYSEDDQPGCGRQSQQAIETDLSLRVQLEEILPEVMGDPEDLCWVIDALLRFIASKAMAAPLF